jgi:hypothetical protein
MLCAVLDIPQPPGSFFMVQAATEAVAQNEEDDVSHITACFDGA